MPRFFICSIIAHLLLFFIIKIDLIPQENIKKKSVTISLVEKKIKESKKKDTLPKKKPSAKSEKETVKKNSKVKQKKVNTQNSIQRKDNSSKKIKDKKNVKEFDDMLKNLAEKEFNSENKNNKFDKKLKSIAEEELNITTERPRSRELALIEKIILEQVNNNWSRPPGVKTSQNLNIRLVIYLNSNGALLDLKVHDQTKKQIKEKPYLKPYLSSAIRAIKKSSPIEGLKKDRYNIWRVVIINFKPREAM